MLTFIAIWIAFVLGFIVGYLQWRYVDKNLMIRNKADFMILRDEVRRLREQKKSDAADWWKA